MADCDICAPLSALNPPTPTASLEAPLLQSEEKKTDVITNMDAVEKEAVPSPAGLQSIPETSLEKAADAPTVGTDDDDDDERARATESFVVSVDVSLDTEQAKEVDDIEKIWKMDEQSKHSKQSKASRVSKSSKASKTSKVSRLTTMEEIEMELSFPNPAAKSKSKSIEERSTTASPAIREAAPSPEPVLEPAPEPSKIDFVNQEERDFDKNPTALYCSIQRKQWKETIECLKKNPKDAQTWISRKEDNGQLRWRILPIHAAMIFNAPVDVVEALLTVYEDGVKSRDDQGMLPLHLSFRMASPDEIVKLLLKAFPESVGVRDRKGRTAYKLAEASNAAHKKNFLKLLESVPTPRTTDTPISSSARAKAEQRAIEARFADLSKGFEDELAIVKEEASAIQAAMGKEISSLQSALHKNKETSQVLVDHIASLESQLQQRTETEKYLAPKIAAFDGEMRSTITSTEEVEVAFRNEFAKLNLEKRDLESKASRMQTERDATTKALRDSVKSFEATKTGWAATKEKQEIYIARLEKDCRSLRTDVEVLENEVKSRTASEKSLAGQVASLASQLQNESESSGNSTAAFSTRIRTLEREREELRFSVDKLSKKLYSVAGMLNTMGKEQAALVEQALGHEGQAAELALTQADALTNMKAHAEIVERAKAERQEIMDFMNKRVEELEYSKDTSASVLNAVEEQAEQLARTSENRLEFITGVTHLKDRMGAVLNTVYVELPRDEPDDDKRVDEVLQNILVEHHVELSEQQDKVVSPHISPVVEEPEMETPVVEEPKMEDLVVEEPEMETPTAELSSPTDEVTVATGVVVSEQSNAKVLIEETPEKKDIEQAQEDEEAVVDEPVPMDEKVQDEDALVPTNDATAQEASETETTTPVKEEKKEEEE